MVFFGLMGAVALQGHLVGAGDHTSLLRAYVSGEEVSEGPLDPSAYAQSDAAGVGGSRLAFVDATDSNFITFDDPEVQFAQTLEGNAIVAPLQPVVDEEGDQKPAPLSTPKPFIYTVKEGDTIAGIAGRFGISANTILSANGLRANDIIKAGDHFTILPTTGILHTVVGGDTVLEIAQKYNAKASDIVTYNNLEDSGKISLGQKLIIPDGYITPQEAPRIVSGNTLIARDPEESPTAPEGSSESAGEGFVWPTITKHISQYFKFGHTGIDIDNRSRPSVFAAMDGTVQFTGWLGGYGNLVIINHGGGLTTYYAHLDKFYTSPGAKVAKGDAVGKMGSTGRSTGPHVHFEVRRFGKPINPLGMYN